MKAARRLRRIIKLAGMALVVAAVTQEINKPEAERTWKGRVLGVPYDFRPPTWEILRDAYWSPDDPRLLMDRPFGVGWAINFGRAWTLVGGVLGSRRMPAPIRKAEAGIRRSARGLQEVATGVRQTADAGSSLFNSRQRAD